MTMSTFMYNVDRTMNF